MKKRLMAAYLAVTLLLCALPFAGLLWKKSEASTENRQLAEFPQRKSGDGWNTEFLPQLGAYFEDHFAYRQEMVTADALLRGALGVSAQDGVIRGTDGWLYYKDSLDDYLGSRPLTDRGIFNIARTLRMMQDYVEDDERQFLFAVAPNKNSLYGEHMPYYYQVKAGQTRNVDRLFAALEEQGVHYTDLYGVLGAQDEVLYHRRDSHWNNKGAALAAETMLEQMGRPHASYQDMAFTVRTDFEGDLDKMLYPLAVTPEEEIYYDDAFSYEYLGEVESNFDPEIKTRQEQGMGSLLMFRDSFGNALLPFFAQEFRDAEFSRGVPYYLDEMYFCDADAVVVERAERFLPDMAASPPVFQSPLRMADVDEASEAAGNGTTCEAAAEGMYVRFQGEIDPAYVQENSLIYFRLDKEKVYEAFPMNLEKEGALSDCGYAVCVEKERLEGDAWIAELFVETDGEITKVFQTDLNLTE